MYTVYCGDRDIYSLFVSENLEMILNYLKRTTFSHKLYVDESETAIHVEYVLRASELPEWKSGKCFTIKLYFAGHCRFMRLLLGRNYAEI